ncbi:MAG: shikimate dehydrogenase [Pseudomonadota bacterium]
MDHYAVVGNPVAHSLSPRIHELFARACAQDMSYTTLLAPLEDFAGTVSRFFAEGGAGLNVTVPFKAEAAEWVTEMDAAARAAGAVNTVVPVAGGYRGHNTDGAGLIRDIRGNCGEPLARRRVLVLGAGGAARGALRPLLTEHPLLVTVANRTEDRAVDLAASAAADFPDVPVEGMALAAVRETYDVVINATSAGLGDGAPAAAVNPAVVAGAFCYDMIYAAPGAAAADTAFCRWARQESARRVVDGLGMLVEQAALAFRLWRGVEPDTASVLSQLRRARS